MNTKAEQFDQFLKDRDVTNWFTKEEHQDDVHSVVYRGYFDVAAQQLPLFIVLDDTVFNLIRLVVTTGAVPAEKQADVVAYLNELNGKFKIFKYYLGEDDNVVYMDISLPAANETFDPNLLVGLLLEVLEPHIKEYYPSILGKVLDSEETTTKEKGKKDKKDKVN